MVLSGVAWVLISTYQSAYMLINYVHDILSTSQLRGFLLPTMLNRLAENDAKRVKIEILPILTFQKTKTWCKWKVLKWEIYI